MRLPRLLSAGFIISFVLGFGYGKAAGVPWRAEIEGSSPLAAAPGTHGTGATGPTGPTAAGSTLTVGTAPAGGLPPGGRIPTPAAPLRVVMAGDSVMAGLSPAVKAALESGGAADVRFVLTPSILRDATVRFTWEQQLEQFDPEVVVMFVGTWESREVEDGSGQAVTLGDPRWRQSYESQILDPWVQLITSQGARVVWIGSPAAVNPEANLVFAGLNAVFSELPTRFPQLTYLDASTALQGSNPGFTPIVALPDGRLVRTRQVDGLHLCADGAALLGAEVVQRLVDEWRAPVGEGWSAAGATWRQDAKLYPAESCPSVG